ncbi:MAG: glycosyltransferase family 4 protein [Sporolactobacillus sp.]
MKIAIVHEWFSAYAGSEKVVEQLLKIFPEADVFSLVDFLPEHQRAFLSGKTIKTSFIQRLPFARRAFRNYLPLMPLAIEQFDLSGYDLIISSSHAVSKGVITGPDQLHLSYVHSPMRYAWDLQMQYLQESHLEHGLKSWVVRYMLHRIRIWDARTANGVDSFIANSKYIARRIWKIYRREATVIYPPVSIDAFTMTTDKNDFYVTASRMVPYKKMNIIVEAFNQMPDKILYVIGDGPAFKAIKKRAAANIKLLGYQDFVSLRDYMQRARAFIFAAEEDFGITPVEAQACGTPVIAYGRGGVLETVRAPERDHPTGLFFEQQTAASIVQAVQRFERISSLFTPEACRKNAERFSEKRFRTEIEQFVAERLSEWRRDPRQDGDRS